MNPRPQPIEFSQTLIHPVANITAPLDRTHVIHDPILPPDHPRSHEQFGDILGPKDKQTTRLYFINLNSVAIDNNGGEWHQICEAMTAIQVDIAGFCELNRDTTQYSIRSAMEKVCSSHFNHHHLVLEFQE